MNIVVLDITGRNATQYNPSLCTSLSEREGLNVTLLSPTLHCKPSGYCYKKLFKIIPEKLTASEGGLKRGLRLLEVILNYMYLLIYILFNRPNILHIQWLPLIEFASGEKFVLKFLKLLSSKTKIVLTVHNIYPHNINVEEMPKYRRRFLHLNNIIDAYIVHLYSSKNELSADFGILEDKIHVAYHGIYVADKYNPKMICENNYEKKIIMFGYQNYYKGTDLLIEALKKLPKEYQKKVKVLIVGKTDSTLYDKYQSECNKLNVNWINRFVSDEELYDAIGGSDLILLPYRKISQSGVLLLSLSYKKPILTSDLPSFKETLVGYPDDYFFKSEDSNSLSLILQKYLDGIIDENRMKSIIEKLNIKYSWSETAKSTLNAYNSCLL